MSEDKDTIQKLQALLEDSNLNEGDYLKFSNLLQEVYNKTPEKELKKIIEEAGNELRLTSEEKRFFKNFSKNEMITMSKNSKNTEEKRLEYLELIEKYEKYISNIISKIPKIPDDFYNDIKDEIDEIEFTEKMKNDLKERHYSYFKYDILDEDDIQILCELLNITYEGLSSDEVYELMFKPENVLKFKTILFENLKTMCPLVVKEHIEYINEYINKQVVLIDENDKRVRDIGYLNCKKLLTEYILQKFKSNYILSCDTRRFLKDGELCTDTMIQEGMCDRVERMYESV